MAICNLTPAPKPDLKQNVILRICSHYREAVTRHRLTSISIGIPDVARNGGVEVGGWTVDPMIRVRFLTYPHRKWAL